MNKTFHDRMTRCLLTIVVATLALASSAPAQISLTSAVDLAVRGNPRVKVAEADVDRARASLSEARDAYIPNLSAGGSGYGKSYGYPLGQPTILNVQTQSLVFNYSQQDYIRAARIGLTSATSSLLEAREAVAEDTVLTYLALEHDRSRLQALAEQRFGVEKLISILQDRIDAGQDQPIDLTSARLNAAQIRLSLLHSEDELAIDQLRLAHLTGLPAATLLPAGDVPEVPSPATDASSPVAPSSPAIDAAFANARAKQEIAFGDARYLFRPQISFAAEYSRLSTYNNSSYLEYFGRRDQFGNLLPFPSDSFGIGVQVTIPFLDFTHRAKARESAADARHAQREAEQFRDQFTEGRLRLQRTALELAARADIAALDQQLAQQELDILLVQLNAGNPNGQQMTPKDEQRSRVAEREKYLVLLDARFQLRQAQVNLLRQTGQLLPWLRSAVLSPPTPPSSVSATPTSTAP